MGIGRSIQSQEEEKSDSGGDCKSDVESSVFLFSNNVEPIENLFLDKIFFIGWCQLKKIKFKKEVRTKTYG